MNLLGMTVLALIAFAIGFMLVSWVIDRFRGGISKTTIHSTRIGGTVPAHPAYEDPETRYARVLGIPRNFTTPEIKDRYRTLIASYHPDKMAHLGPELQHMADQKTREIIEAYEYFRVKYRLT